MSYRYRGWDDAERRPARRHARPFYRYHFRLLLDAVIVFAAIVVLIVITSTGY